MYLLHRISGIILFLFLIIHFSTINKLKNDTINEFLQTLKTSPLLKVFEYFLILVASIHILLGIKILLLESELISAKNPYLDKLIICLLLFTAIFILFFGNFL